MRIFICGVFDLFHYGHMDFMKRSKLNKDDVLIVGVHTDEETKQNKRIPIMKMEERVRAVKMCRYVDEVVEACPYNLSPEMWLEFKNKYQIDQVLACSDYDKDGDECYSGPRFYGDVVYLDRTPEISTTDIIQRISLRLN